MIETRSILNETVRSIAEAAKRLPSRRQGKPVSTGCLMRWILSGIRTPHGRVRLEAVRLGGQWLTSDEALERFAAALTPPAVPQPPLPRTASAQRAFEKAEAWLDKVGL